MQQAVCHEEVLTTTLVRHKEEMELIMECLKKVEKKLLVEQTKKETQHAKCLGFESEVQLLKEQKKSAIQANEMCEKALLEKIQGLEEHVQLASVKEKEVAA